MQSRPAILRSESQFCLQAREQTRNIAVTNSDTFGLTRGTGSEHDIRQISTTQIDARSSAVTGNLRFDTLTLEQKNRRRTYFL